MTVYMRGGRMVFSGGGRALARPPVGSPFVVAQTGTRYTSMQAAHDAASSGDTIWVGAGNPTASGANAVCAISKNLRVHAIGGWAHLFAAGQAANDHGIWDAIGAINLYVTGIWFHNATASGDNGAAIWGGSGTNITCTDCKYDTCQDGMLLGNSGGIITITRGEFIDCGAGDGQSHGIYVGDVDVFVASQCFFHGAVSGHNCKTRAKQSRIENCYLMDGSGGTSSYLLDCSNGGDVYLRGNCFSKGPNAENHTALIAYAQEGFTADGRTNQIQMIHNTLVSSPSSTVAWLTAPSGAYPISMTANLLCGNGTGMVTGGYSSGSITHVDEVSSTYDHIVDPDNVSVPNFHADGTLQPSVPLGDVPDATYAADSAVPLIVRALPAGARWCGALQQ